MPEAEERPELRCERCKQDLLEVGVREIDTSVFVTTFYTISWEQGAKLQSRDLDSGDGNEHYWACNGCGKHLDWEQVEVLETLLYQDGAPYTLGSGWD